MESSDEDINVLPARSWPCFCVKQDGGMGSEGKSRLFTDVTFLAVVTFVKSIHPPPPPSPSSSPTPPPPTPQKVGGGGGGRKKGFIPSSS